jgi:PAS domain S-box-containing protein
MTIERVLVVDDDDALLNLMALALRRRGYQVEQACDGFTALKILASNPAFSVLLTDLMMPGMSGLELLREVRKVDTNIEVVVVTAAADLESAISAMRADGAYDYLLKPFESMSQLLLSVERAAAHRRLLIEREQMRLKIQSEADRLRALISNTGDAIISADWHGTLQIVNPAAERLFQSGSLEGTNAMNSLPPALTALISNWQAVSGNLQAVNEMNWQDGSVQMISLTPIAENNEDKLGWVAVLRDITHIKRMEDLKAHLLVEASNRIHIPLAQAMNALVELNILTSQNEQVSDVVYRLTQIWKQIQEWSDDLHALIRIDSGLNLQSTTINVSSVIEEVGRSHREQLLHASGVRLDIKVEEGLSQVVTDPELIRRLLNGLINRSASRSEKGATIQLMARNYNNQVWISVTDEGPAVSDADLPRIFEKSFAKTSSGPGITGLEMALVKTIIDRVGGQIWVGGQGKKGSTIFVCFPTNEQLAAPAQA